MTCTFKFVLNLINCQLQFNAGRAVQQFGNMAHELCIIMKAQFSGDILWMSGCKCAECSLCMLLTGAFEGLAAASVVLLQPQATRQLYMQRNTSFSLKRGISAMKDAKAKSGGSFMLLLLALLCIYIHF